MEPPNMKTVVNMPQAHATDAQPEVAAAAPAERPSGTRLRPSQAEATAVQPQRGPFVPVLLCALALLGWLSFQTVQLLMDRDALQAAYAGQQQTVDNAGKLRTSLDTLAADTQRMADAGNASARVLVEELKKRGVTINTAVASPPR